MSSITDIKSVLTQKGLDTFCQTFYIPDDVHPQLLNHNQTIHEMPTGKIGVYTNFFEYANFRLLLSTFLVNVLRYYHINLSQLSVIAAAKVSHFEILCRVHGIEPTVGLFRCFYVNSKNKGWMSFSKCPDVDAVCYTKPLDSLKRWNGHFFWVDSFACPASFLWHADKNVSRDPFPKSTEFRADDYAILVADPTKVKVGERERAEGEASLLDSIVGRVVPLLLVAPARVKSELEASVERLFDESGSADQGDSAVGGGHDAEIESSMGVIIIAAENVTAERPKRPRKKRQAATDAGGSSHPPKKLRGDYGTSGDAATSGKSPSILKELLASSMLNVEAGVAAVETLPMVTSSVSATPEHESGPPTDSIIGLNLRTLSPTERFVISSNSSHYSSTNAAEAGIDSFVRSVTLPSVMIEAVITTNVASILSAPALKTGTKVVTPIHALMFHDSDSKGTVKPDAAGFSHVPGNELSMGSRDVNSETLYEVIVLQWNVSNDTFLDDHDVSREFIDHLAPPVLFAQIREMDYHHLFTEFNVGTARQACLNAEVGMRAEYCLSERRRLESECEKQAELLKVRDAEIESLKAQLLLKETEASEVVHLRAQVSAAEATEKMHASEIDDLKQKNVALENEKESLDGKKDGLVGQVHKLEATCSGLRGQVSSYERLKEQIEEFQDAQMNIVNEKVAMMDADLLEMALHLEEKFYPHLLNTIFGRRWLLTHGLKLAVVKCLNSQEYLSALGAAISRVIEKGIQDGLSAGINHGKAGRSLEDVAAYNPFAEADYTSALQRLRPLADAPGMSDLQPNIEQLKLPIHRPEDQVILGETSLLVALDVTHSCVERIRENVAAQWSTLIGFWTALVDPLFVHFHGPYIVFSLFENRKFDGRNCLVLFVLLTQSFSQALIPLVSPKLNRSLQPAKGDSQLV
ncbi:hypothetical protein Tco_0428789 [Tanacetum coccineum]